MAVYCLNTMAFEIHDSSGQAVSLNELDKQAAEFWGKEISVKHYASPSDNHQNWFDGIGYIVHSPHIKGEITSWKEYKRNVWSMLTEGGFIGDKYLYGFDMTDEQIAAKVKSTRNYLKPYFDLVDLWESKGYKPKQVEG